VKKIAKKVRHSPPTRPVIHHLLYFSSNNVSHGLSNDGVDKKIGVLFGLEPFDHILGPVHGAQSISKSKFFNWTIAGTNLHQHVHDGIKAGTRNLIIVYP
jgi:hypothetical protein